MKPSIKASLLSLVSVAAALSSCGKSVDLGTFTNADRGPVSKTADCAQTREWHFNQPGPVENRAVDLLFVVDTSASLKEERAQLAQNISAFVDALDPRTDYQIGVMLGHGGASVHSGRLYAPTSTPKVLDSKVLPPSEIRAALAATLSRPAADMDEANGEALLYSLSKSFEPTRLAEMRSAGFYRSNAALSIVLVSDENDLCYEHPPTQKYFPEYVPSIRNYETIAFNRYCAGRPSATPAGVVSAARKFLGERPLAIGAITHIDPARVPRAPGSEDSLGRGLIEAVAESPAGVLLELTDPSYANGLARLGNIVRSSLELKTVFSLDNRQGVVAETVEARVDGNLVPARYDVASGTVELTPSMSGQSGSAIDIKACLE